MQIQSSRLHRVVGRTVTALTIRRDVSPPDHPLTPHTVVQRVAVYANPFDIAILPHVRLQEFVVRLEEFDQDKVIRALDELVSRA